MRCEFVRYLNSDHYVCRNPACAGWRSHATTQGGLRAQKYAHVNARLTRDDLAEETS